MQGGWQTLLLHKILHCKCKYLVRVFSFQKIFASCEYFLCRGGWQTLLLHKILHCKCKYLVRVFSFHSHHVNIFCAGGMANAAVETHVDFRIIFKNLFGNLHADSEKYF